MIEVWSTDGLVMVVLEDCCEGIHGDYDEDDPNDLRLLRFSIYRFCNEPSNPNINWKFEGTEYEFGEWMAVRDGSYCTQIPVASEEHELIEAAKFILEYVEDGVRNYTNEKKLYESLSWTTLIGGQPVCEVGVWNVG